MSEKIRLAEGQQSAEYYFKGDSIAHLGAQLDAFFRNIDYDAAYPSGSVSVDVPLSVIRSHQNGVEKVSFGPAFASLSVYRRGVAE